MSKKRFRESSGYNRSASSKESEQTEEILRAAWRSLAQAGAPRCPKPERARLISLAHGQYDLARGHFTSARSRFAALKEGVQESERRAQAAPPEERGWDRGPKPHEKAGVTTLAPVVSRLTHEMAQMRECLGSFLGHQWRRPRDSAERRETVRMEPLFGRSADDPHRTCSWCGKLEDARYSSDYHIALDGDGYPVRRPEARRFCCYSCFCDGKDLAEPHPKPLPVVDPPEHVASEVVAKGTLALPARTAPALPARGEA